MIAYTFNTSEKKFSVEEVISFNKDFIKSVIKKIYTDQIESLIRCSKDSTFDIDEISKEAKSNTEKYIDVIFGGLKIITESTFDSAEYYASKEEESVDVSIDWKD